MYHTWLCLVCICIWSSVSRPFLRGSACIFIDMDPRMMPMCLDSLNALNGLKNHRAMPPLDNYRKHRSMPLMDRSKPLLDRLRLFLDQSWRPLKGPGHPSKGAKPAPNWSSCA